MDRNAKITCPDYLKFVRKHPCVACGSANVDAHHIKARGAGSGKQNDFTAVPLCRQHHGELHQMGTGAMARAGCNVWEEAAWLMIEFFAVEVGLDRPESMVTIGKASIFI